ncbi:MAG: 23S rRNA pseudouridine(1911/1915/1917) synthase RluD [Gammaproteobacteria bacterium]
MTTIHLQASITPDFAGKRLDQAVAGLFADYSRSQLQRWIEAGFVCVNQQIVTSVRTKVQEEQVIDINAPKVEQTIWQPQALDLSIIYADDSLIVINKPAGVVVHPAAGNREGTLVNALLHAYPELAEIPRAGLVHRLDKDTSGLLVVARTLSAHHLLVKQLQERQIQREYFCIVKGHVISGSTIDAPLGRHPTQRKRRAVMFSGKPAVTHYRVAKRLAHFTGLDVSLETGRTHQIRVHLQHVRLPIIGDPVYGGRRYIPPGASVELQDALNHWHRQALHARRLQLEHPVTGEICEWIAPLPDDLQHFWDILQAWDK